MRPLGLLCAAALATFSCAQGASVDAVREATGHGGAASSTGGGSGGVLVGGAGSGGGGQAGQGGTNVVPGGAGGNGGTAGSAGSAGGGGTTSPCEGKACDSPPGARCEGSDLLIVQELPGRCDELGECQYARRTETCAFGCADGACVGDPCAAVSCNSPDASFCANASELRVYEARGTCAEGKCTYGFKDQTCAFGCAENACSGDPCVGVRCDTPTEANRCAGNDLLVYEAPGTCSAGACSYASHLVPCDFGCENGACKGDPCAGVTCNKPRANTCVSPQKLRTYASVGTCKDGGCSYSYTDTTCQHGCADGACLACSVNSDCGGGLWCDGGTCKSCNDDTHCGAACADCTGTGRTCGAGGQCIACKLDTDCGSGRWCGAGDCLDCTTALHCGSTCQACSGASPDCRDAACSCTASSCPSNQRCQGASCQVCKSDGACGAACTACGGATPRCLDGGATSRCVECVGDGDCAGGKVCKSNACVDPGCPPPAASCTTGTQNRDKCSNARVIGRTAAAASGGYSVRSDTCWSYNRFIDDTPCGNGNADEAYRIYMRSGETLRLDLDTLWPCETSQFWWYATLAVYENGGCGDTACTSRSLCSSESSSQVVSFTASHDGWYIIVVDGANRSNDNGDYALTVELTCAKAGCECP